MIGFKNVDIQNLAVEIGFDLSEYEKIYKNRIDKVIKKLNKKEMLKTVLAFPILFFILLIITMFFILIINKSIAGFVLVFMISFLINTLGSIIIGIGFLLLRLEKVIKEIFSVAGEAIALGVKKIEKAENIDKKEIINQIITLIIIPEIASAIKKTFAYMGLIANKKIQKYVKEITDKFLELIELDKIKNYAKYIKNYKLNEYEEMLSAEISSVYTKVGRFISNITSNRLVKVDWLKLLDFQMFNRKLKMEEEKENFSIYINNIKEKAVISLTKIRKKVFIVGLFFILIEIIQVILLFIILNQ